MIKFAVVALCLWTTVATAALAKADAIDTPAQACISQYAPSFIYDKDGIGNNSTTANISIWCPVVLEAATGRTLFVSGTDQNSVYSLQCQVFAWDINLAMVTINNPNLVGPSGTYTNGTVGSVAIPDNVAKVDVKCTLPFKQTNVSEIGDIFVVW